MLLEDLIKAVRDDYNKDKEKALQIGKKVIGEIVGSLLRVIQDELSLGQKIVLGKLGSLQTRVQKATTKRNPKTGESVDVPEKIVAKFTPFAKLRELLNTND